MQFVSIWFVFAMFSFSFSTSLYICPAVYKASSKYFNISWNISLLAPGVPENVQLVSISHSQLRLSWQPPSNPNGIITGYSVTWKMVSNDRETQVNGTLSQEDIPATNSSFVINSLSEYTKWCWYLQNIGTLLRTCVYWNENHKGNFHSDIKNIRRHSHGHVQSTHGVSFCVLWWFGHLLLSQCIAYNTSKARNRIF